MAPMLLNSHRVGLIGAALILAAITTFGHLVTDSDYVFNLALAIYRIPLHLSSTEDVKTFAKVVAPLLGMAFGGVLTYFGRPLNVPHPPAPLPPDGEIVTSIIGVIPYDKAA